MMKPVKTSEQYRAEGSYYAAGRKARTEGKPRYYGCHTGMRSTRDAAMTDFFHGWDDEDFFQMRRAARSTTR